MQPTWSPQPLHVRDLRLRSAASPWSMTLRAGDRVALRGATGAGKTTFLRTLLGLMPAEGILRYGATVLDTEVPVDARPFAWLPQEAPVLLGSVRDNLRPQDEEAVVHSLLPLPFEGDLTGRTLSGGERQLLGLARALESKAPVLLLDEPTSALDATTKQWVLDVLCRDPRAMILATHDDDVLRIATHIAEISQEGALHVFEKREAEAVKVA